MTNDNVKFNIVERNETEDFIDEFIKLYYDKTYNKNEICKILDISGRKYIRIKNELIKEGKLDKDFRIRQCPKNAKYYFKDKRRNKYVIKRNIRKKQVYFMEVDTEEEAKFCVNLFNRYGWLKRSIPFIRTRIAEEFKGVVK